MSKKDITFNTLEIRVEYTYTLAEPQQKHSGDLDGYPGSDSSVEISDIYLRVNGNYTVKLLSFFEESGLIYKLEEQLKKELDEEND